jgi:hypothetical protein
MTNLFFHSLSYLILPDVGDKISEERPEFVRAREPDDMLGSFDQLETGAGHQVSYLFNQPARTNIFVQYSRSSHIHKVDREPTGRVSYPELLVAKGFQRINLRGAAGRSPTRQQRHTDE